MTAMGRIKRRQSNEAMDAAFGLQIAVGVRSSNLDRHALDAGLFAWCLVENIDAESVAFTPTQIHAQEHLRPVLGLGAAGAGVDRHDSRPPVVLATKGQRELQLVEAANEL